MGRSGAKKFSDAMKLYNAAKSASVNNLNVEPKSRWPLDKSAPYMKGPGLKL